MGCCVCLTESPTTDRFLQFQFVSSTVNMSSKPIFAALVLVTIAYGLNTLDFADRFPAHLNGYQQVIKTGESCHSGLVRFDPFSLQKSFVFLQCDEQTVCRT